MTKAHRRSFRRAAGLAIVLVWLGSGMAGADEWFDAYARGLDALEKSPDKAAEHLERAVRLRPDPGNNVITYGTNRLERYYPYLRLAEAYLALGQPDKAAEALRRSAARAREPADERARLMAQVAALVESTRVAAATPAPPSTTIAPAPPPVSLAAATPLPVLAPSAGPSAPVPPPPSTQTAVVETDQGFPVRIKAGRRTSEARTLVATTVAPSPAASPVEVAVPPTTVGPPVEVALAPRAAPGLWLGGALAVVLLAAVVLAWFRRREPDFSRGGTIALPTTTGSSTPAMAPTRPAPSPVGSGPTDVGAPTVLEEAIETSLLAPAAAGTRLSGGQEAFGEFRLVCPLGKGGMASVFKAERGGEFVALKRPLAAFLEEPEFLERFLREAEIGRTLHHPNIIRIFERGEVDRMPFFTMELIDGETLQARVRRQGAFEARAAARVVAQVAEALDYAHLKGVIHRDLKPSNIMILADGTVKVMDYGIARARRFEGLTVTGAFLGTPEYVAPETAQGKGTDARSDLYSLGVVFYEILTGKKPFLGDTPFATLQKQVAEPPTPPSVIAPGVPRELEAIILRLLSKDPEDRYPGAEELLIALRDYLNRAGSPAAPPAP